MVPPSALLKIAAPLAFLAVLSAVPSAGAEEFDLRDLLPSDPPESAQTLAEEAEAQAALSRLYCDRFGPGYELVAGTQTCIRVSGYARFEVFIGGKR